MPQTIRSWFLPTCIALTVATHLPTAAQDSAPTAPPGPGEYEGLDARALENLVAFTQFLGYIRYLHPSDGVASSPWGDVARAGAWIAIGAASPAELAARLEDLVRPIAPTVRVVSRDRQFEGLDSEASPPGATEVVQWIHNPGEFVDGSYFNSRRARAPLLDGRIPEGFEDPRRPWRVDLAGGVTALIPLATYADETGTLPRAEAAGTVLYDAASNPDAERITRFAAVALAWNVLDHFYPYFDTARADWNAELRRALMAAATDVDECAFHETLERMVAALEDGHAVVVHPRCFQDAEPPIVVDWIENRLVVTHVDDPDVALDRGDVLTLVDGEPAESVFARVMEKVSASTEGYRRGKALSTYFLRGPRDSEVTITVTGARGTRSVALVRKRELLEVKEPRPAPITEVREGIFYVDLDAVELESFEEALPRLAAARGLIFDLRRYVAPGVAIPFLTRLSREPVEAPQFHLPRVSGPDPSTTGFTRLTAAEWRLESAAPYLSPPRVFLAGPSTVSQPETLLMLVERYGLGEIVGEGTAGTNGDIRSTSLPGSYRMIWTGLRVLRHDGSRYHGLGVEPTVRVERTLAGVRDGVDEALEAAVDLILAAPAAR